MNLHQIENGVTLILKGLGVNPLDHNYTMTPERYAKALMEMFCQPETDWAVFEEEYTDFILLRSHTMWSLCPHHLLPVQFKVSLAYIPGGQVLGLSKLARVLQECNSGPLLQEAFTKAAINKLHSICYGVRGIACLVEGIHSCLSMRGVKSSADFVTYRMDGLFSDDKDLERRFFELARRRG